jgi:hypothetical protein
MNIVFRQIIFLVFISTHTLFAQEETLKPKFFDATTPHKGKLFFSWGYNRAEYSNSSIHFTGKTYDFTVENAKAVDAPYGFSVENYFTPDHLTIPQYNFSVGYYLSNKYAISLNVDHMKYVMVQNQMATINGYIADNNLVFDGVYQNQLLKLSDNFLTYEHTDGLNYVNLEGSATQELYGNRKKTFTVETIAGLGFGFLFPKSNVKLLTYPRNDAFHLAGYGISSRLAINFTFFKRLFLQVNLKGGFLNMTDVVTRGNSDDRASQSFFFLQENMVLGVYFPIRK